MPDFSFPSWILPKESPWEALLKGAQVGNMIAQNRYRNQALYAQIQQNQQENELRERDLMMRNTAQDLHNQALRRKLDYDSHDLPLMTDSITEVQRETDMDKLRSWPTPQFSDSDNAIKFNQILSSRILRLSSTTSQRQLADDIAYNTKFDDALDSDLRQISKQGLNERGIVDGMEGAQLRQFAADEQQRRNEEAKLRLFKAEEEERRKTRTVTVGDKSIMHVGNKIVQLMPDGTVQELFDSKGKDLSDVEKIELSSAFARLKNAETQLGKVDILDEEKNTFRGIIAEANGIINRFRSKSAAPSETAEPRVTTKEQFDKLPSGTIYIGEDGRKYRKP